MIRVLASGMVIGAIIAVFAAFTVSFVRDENKSWVSEWLRACLYLGGVATTVGIILAGVVLIAWIWK